MKSSLEVSLENAPRFFPWFKDYFDDVDPDDVGFNIKSINLDLLNSYPDTDDDNETVRFFDHRGQLIETIGIIPYSRSQDIPIELPAPVRIFESLISRLLGRRMGGRDVVSRMEIDSNNDEEEGDWDNEFESSSSETVIEVLKRLGDRANDVHFIVLDNIGSSEYEEEITVYKIPDGYTLSEWITHLQGSSPEVVVPNDEED